jgi:WD40 repeat protein
VACGSKEGTVSVFDTLSGKAIQTIEGILTFKYAHNTAHVMPVRSVAFSHDGKVLLSGADDMHINLFDA